MIEKGKKMQDSIMNTPMYKDLLQISNQAIANNKANSNVMVSFPDKVSVTNVEGIPNCKWIGRYF